MLQRIMNHDIDSTQDGSKVSKNHASPWRQLVISTLNLFRQVPRDSPISHLFFFSLEDRRIPYRVWRIRAETSSAVSSGVNYPGLCFSVKSTCTSTCTTDIRRRRPSYLPPVELLYHHTTTTPSSSATLSLQSLLSLTRARATAIILFQSNLPSH